MPAALEKIEREALSLSPRLREALAGKLLHSIQDLPLNEIDEAWIEEAERRFRNYMHGKTRPIPAARVFKTIRRKMEIPGTLKISGIGTLTKCNF
jgi:hypothetical protein